MQDEHQKERESMERFEVFPWNRNFETGNETIDNQHKKLVELLNQLARTLIQDDSAPVNKAFEALAEYAEYHFEEEEEIWNEHFEADDNWLNSHQMSHAAFLPKVVEIKEQEDKLPLPDIVEGIVKFLIRWLAFHIIDNDKRMALAVKSLQDGNSLDEAKRFADKKMSGSMRVLIETILSMYDGLSSSAIAMMRERSARMKAEMELARTQSELKSLRGILPICAHCKKIRNEAGAWDKLESYINAHSEATFSHSVCPECVSEHYSEFNLKTQE